MAEQRPSARKHPAHVELVAILRDALEEIAARRAAERDRRRRTLTVVPGGRRNAA